MANEIPVYLFVGFLESGKTKFIQETFEDPNFDSGDKTLLLVCEEGEEEYNEKKFAFPGVTLYNLEDKAELNPQNLAKLAKEADAEILPVVLDGTKTLIKKNLAFNWGNRITVRVLPPVPAERVAALETHELMQEVHERMCTALGEVRNEKLKVKDQK